MTRDATLGGTIRSFLRTMVLEATAPMDGGFVYFVGGFVVRFLRMYLLLGVWKSIYAARGATIPADESMVLQYTVLASALFQQVNVVTTASMTLWEGTVSSRYLRPMSVFGQYISETVGRWLPGLMFFTLPVLLGSGAFGVDLGPASTQQVALFTLSLGLGIASGFAMDFIFAGIMVMFGDMHYFAYQVRAAVSSLLSGALIPLYLLPWGLGRVLQWLPFAATASAPLQIYTGTGDATRLISLQAVWCVIMWVSASAMWKANRQRLVIFRG